MFISLEILIPIFVILGILLLLGLAFLIVYFFGEWLPDKIEEIAERRIRKVFNLVFDDIDGYRKQLRREVINICKNDVCKR